MQDYEAVPLPHSEQFSAQEMTQKAESYYQLIKRRHSVRHFSDEPVPRQVIETCIKAAGTAPSGANHQPWHFVCVGDASVKRKIRIAAEHEEAEFYGGRAGADWLEDLDKLGTDAEKPFLETAPWLIAIFLERSGTDEEGKSVKTTTCRNRWA